MKTRLLWTLSTAVMLAAPLATARADILFYTSSGNFTSAANTYDLTQENVLTQGAGTGTTVFGVTNQTNAQVDVMSLNNSTLSVAESNGQARFTGMGSGGFEIFLANGGSFTSILFNLAGGTAGLLNLGVLEVDNTVDHYQYDLASNGQNFVGFLAINGQRIENVSVSGNATIDALEQLRVGGVQGATTTTPEPATLALLGSGLAGLAGLVGITRRRRQMA